MMIPITKAYTPSLTLYKAFLDEIWSRRWYTNHGPLVELLENKLKIFSESEHAFFVTNGTTALQIAIRSLGLTGELITTPFSYVATTSSIVWENCVPIFADIDPKTWNISPSSILSKITSKTTAIIATHVYGNSCDINSIEIIAKKHNLKVIYDAAHCFGSLYNNKSIYSFGDISTASFHATKLFHTVEGGAIFCNNKELANKISYMRNFGHNGQEAFWGLGINGKNSEIHAAIGLAIWPDIDKIIQHRKEVYFKYLELLLPLIENRILQMPILIENATSNYSYVPILLPSENHLLKLRDLLNKSNIYPRRYFYPALHTLPYVTGNCPIAQDYSSRVLCLPSFFDLKLSEIKKITAIIINYSKLIK